mgnify:CR=1 FL=1
MGAKGEFKRKDSAFRDIVQKGGRFKPEGEEGVQGCAGGSAEGWVGRRRRTAQESVYVYGVCTRGSR